MRNLHNQAPVNPVDGHEYRWSELQGNGNINHYIQVGVRPSVFVGWDGAVDGMFHLAKITDESATNLPGVPLNRLDGVWYLATDTDKVP